jgi:3' exoribonuclease, RNase T-like
MIKHVMLDLETMGARPTSAIVSIGAVEFDPHASGYISNFYRNVSLADCTMNGLTMEPSTVIWWVAQAPEPCKALIDPAASLLTDALASFYNWFRKVSGGQPTRLWARGPDFDAVILANAYAACHMSVPWSYNMTRCVRTVCDIADLDLSTIPGAGTSHDALDDALFQVTCVQAAYLKLAVNRRLPRARTAEGDVI